MQDSLSITTKESCLTAAPHTAHGTTQSTTSIPSDPISFLLPSRVTPIDICSRAVRQDNALISSQISITHPSQSVSHSALQVQYSIRLVQYRKMNPNTKRVPATIMSRPNNPAHHSALPQSPQDIQYLPTIRTTIRHTEISSHISQSRLPPSLSKNSNNHVSTCHHSTAHQGTSYSKTPHLPTTTQPHTSSPPALPCLRALVVKATCAATRDWGLRGVRAGPYTTRGSWGTVAVGDGGVADDVA